jgi:hypothetical protein
VTIARQAEARKTTFPPTTSPKRTVDEAVDRGEVEIHGGCVGAPRAPLTPRGRRCYLDG